LLVAVSILAIRTIRPWPWFIVGWLWYLGTLVPVIGLLQVGAQAMADRYTYVPLIGLFIIMAWGFPELIAGWRHKKKVLAWAGAFLLITFMVSSWFQVRHWKDSYTLYKRALHVTQNNYFAHDGMGLFLASRGKNDEAIHQYSEALRIRPDFAEAHNHLGNVLKVQGLPAEAIYHYKEALRIKPEYAEAHYNLGHILAGQGKLADAVKKYSAALKFRPEYPEVHYHLASALMRQGKSDAAIAHYVKALDKWPTDAEIFNQLGIAMIRKGMIEEATAHFQMALKIQPGNEIAQKNLNQILQAPGGQKKEMAQRKK
jgi:tetratricopeptide (TPR) repeat protein